MRRCESALVQQLPTNAITITLLNASLAAKLVLLWFDVWCLMFVMVDVCSKDVAARHRAISEQVFFWHSFYVSSIFKNKLVCFSVDCRWWCCSIALSTSTSFDFVDFSFPQNLIFNFSQRFKLQMLQCQKPMHLVSHKERYQSYILTQQNAYNNNKSDGNGGRAARCTDAIRSDIGRNGRRCFVARCSTGHQSNIESIDYRISDLFVD